jgi:GNAT superfamily N-acetyltransferase
MNVVERIQAQLRHSAGINYEAVPVPPFTLFFNSDTDSPYANYAIPDAPVGGELGEPLTELRATFAAHSRQPRFEFIEAYAPELPATLQAHGFVEETPTYLMICTPATFQPAPEVPGLSVLPVPGDAPLHVLQELLSILHQAFGVTSASVTVEEAAQYRQRYAGLQMFTAQLEGRSVGGASLTQAYEGLVELGGVGTVAAFRGQGVAAAVCARAVETAFAQGINLVFLTAGDERAGRVYARVGFQYAGTGLSYIDSLPPASHSHP